MADGGRLSVASIGVLLMLSGAFLLLWARRQMCLSEDRECPRSRAVGWWVLAAGAAFVTLALLLPATPPPPIPEFLKKP